MNGVRWVAVVLLSFLAVSAIAGGLPMIANPHGSPAGLPHSLLHTTPFRSFMAPGILLLFFNGLLALFCLWLVWRRKTAYGGWTAFQGVVLLVWLIVECAMLRTVVWAHYLYGVVAGCLIVAGIALESGRKPERSRFEF